ncbi:MAG: glycosyltransferase [Candidatus Aminicenantes bacterium]|nr:glycosyltransferase [Candidatus Aminicenantes bacterium]
MSSVESSNVKTPTVSIGMPVYNDQEYVSQALDSLLAQSFEDFELIISDNASTDRTKEICQEYAEKDRRIRYIRQPINLGPHANSSYLLRQAAGEFFMWAASDDLWDKEFIRTLISALRTGERCASAFSPFLSIDENANPISETQSYDYSGRNVLLRVLKFCHYYNDAFFYGLHRIQLIKDVKIPVWWWINSKITTNCAYPVLLYFLACGMYVQAGESPLWLNRLHLNSQPRHGNQFQDRHLIGYLAFLLQKINLLYESVRYVYLGRRSIPITLATTPILATRVLYDCLLGTSNRIFASIRLLRRWVRKHFR